MRPQTCPDVFDFDIFLSIDDGNDIRFSCFICKQSVTAISGNSRYGLFANEAGKSDIVSIIDTQKDVKVKDIWTGLGPHNVAFDPDGKFAVISTKKENVATLVDTASPDPNEWDVITTDLDSGIQNNGVRWVPSPAALKKALAQN